MIEPIALSADQELEAFGPNPTTITVNGNPQIVLASDEFLEPEVTF